MTNQERFEKYVKEYCKNCKTKNKDLCEIRISQYDDVITTKCSYYERKD